MISWMPSLCAVGAIALTLIAGPRPFAVRVVFSLTESAPKGWFLVKHDRMPQVGDYVLSQLPMAAAALADERGYLSFGTPVVKRVAGVTGQVACMDGENVLVDDQVVGATLQHDGRGRPLTPWAECRVLDDEVFLVGDRSPASFDSRYFGPVSRTLVVGRAQPLWIW